MGREASIFASSGYDLRIAGGSVRGAFDKASPCPATPKVRGHLILHSVLPTPRCVKIYLFIAHYAGSRLDAPHEAS